MVVNMTIFYHTLLKDVTEKSEKYLRMKYY